MAAPKMQDVQGDLLAALRGFVPRDVACGMVGLQLDVFEDWMARGAVAKSGRYREFALAVQKAEASAEAGLVLLMAKAAKNGDQKAIQFLLERARAERWAKRSVAVRPAPAPLATPAPPGEDEGWDLDNVMPIRPGG